MSKLKDKFINKFDTQLGEIDDVVEKSQKTEKSLALEVLNISPELDLSSLITSDEISKTEFTLVAPTGINPDELEAFMDKIIIEIDKFYNVINKRESDFKKLQGEVVRLEKTLAKQQEDNELTNFINNTKSNEEALKEEITDLKLENLELKQKLKSYESTTDLKPLSDLNPPKKVNNFEYNNLLPSIDDL